MPIMNGTKISVLTKTSQNEEKTTSKVQSDIAMQLSQSPDPINMSVWADVDITGDKRFSNYNLADKYKFEK